MYSLSVRDRTMIAHSLPGEVFGPAQGLHGATYVVDAVLARPELDAHNLVADIGLAGRALRAVLAGLDYRNLDEHPDFRGKVTTTECLARAVWEGLAARIRAGELGESARDIRSLKIVLHESDVAWAAYEGELAP